MADPRTRLGGWWHQALLAVAFLTRLPVARWLPAQIIPLSSAAWAFPLAGALVGGAGALALTLAVAAGVSPLAAALLALAAMILTTGGLHEDGLADYADATGGTTRERRLEIMRDSRIGSYGVLALLISVGLRVAAMAVVAPLALIGVAMISRAGMVVAMRALPPARADGLGHAARRPPRGAVAAALLLGLAGLLLTTGGQGALLALICLAMQALTAWRAVRLIGGQTGDVLGTIQQTGEIAALIALMALTSPALT
ncbi:MAG: adenosylcobinamide-GDP ribazoletransferase [Paracoccus sp. (in: a-proteobacteria)]|uniref:adenosylcobinamide-GDP ribazoletransferase n=1 Tax=Paracoccus sp. TaxID=267 RepID=UPI0026DF3043|nr:adenosylcobinamide-GDP ribazoletransferase [Paracoccus sp. (in: a-proteobacteria)]MDO5612224.1 adenosylcobinamide-GDP ribazoletransferase [Paracoccus sp. (in: a-proteobacteria)]